MANASDDAISNIDVLKIMEELDEKCTKHCHNDCVSYLRGNQLTQILSSVKEHERQKVNNFFLDVNQRRLEFKLSKEEVQDIQDAVDESIDRLLSHMGAADPAFEVSRKYAVGSMAEGTSIGEPDEFDFIAVLKRWSEPGAVKVERVVHSYYFVPRVFFTSREHASITFTDSAHEYVQQRNKGYWKYREYEKRIFDKAFTKFKDTVVVKRTGTLSVVEQNAEFHGPVCSVMVNWRDRAAPVKDMKISVDVALAIEIKEVSSIILEKDVFHQQYYEKLKQIDRYLLIPMKKCYPTGFRPGETCCLFTFTNTEVLLVKSLSDNHILCIRILKFLFSESNISALSSVLTSYLVKTCVLKHAVSCDSNNDTFQCMVDILCIILFNVICDNAQNGGRVGISSLFLSPVLVSDKFLNIKECKIVIRFILDIIKLFVNICQSTTYSFEDSISQFSELTTEVRRIFPHTLFNEEEKTFYEGYPESNT